MSLRRFFVIIPYLPLTRFFLLRRDYSLRCLVYGCRRRDVKPRPYGLCHDNAVMLRPAGSDSRGRLSLRFVPRLMHCGGECLSAGREAPPYGLCLFWCIAVGNAFRRDAWQRPTDCASFGALRWVMPFGGTRGSALRIVPLLVHCGG